MSIARFKMIRPTENFHSFHQKYNLETSNAFNSLKLNFKTNAAKKDKHVMLPKREKDLLFTETFHAMSNLKGTFTQDQN